MQNVDMPLEIALARSSSWMEEYVSLVDGISFDTTNRLRVAVSLLHLCNEHQQGIHSLVNLGVIGSAFALVRPQFEAYVRGVWIHRCATDDQISSFLSGSGPPRIDDLIKAIETLEAFDKGLLNRTKQQTWRNLNDFTHGGAVQVKARYSMNEVKTNYRPEHVVGLLASAASLSLLAGVAIAAVVGTEALARKLQASFQRIYGTAA